MSENALRRATSAPRSRRQEKPEVQVPERPSLAPNVELCGQAQDSAYEQQPWLAQRDGRFIQLTELLYQVLAQINGQRSLDEIAQNVGAAINRGVSGDNIRQLIAGKLIPLGLVPNADGTVFTAEMTGRNQPRSALQINMRVKALRPEWINPFTAVLQYLYWPPVLIAVLAAALAAQAWLFFVHGIAGSIRDAIYHPDLMLILLALIIVATTFHEFGHASALRYGGGEVRGMGMGLYIVYPAFYTDVSDNYRLPRWSRVRTDLGGFYFNLIFGLVMVGAYLVTGQSYWLLVILLIDIDILHQLLPFVRLDGYWTLADLTGMPDFFSQMMPFLRSVVPFLGGKSSASPLKRWVKITFGTYILITVPLLGALLFLMLKNAPRIVATGIASGGTQIQALRQAQAAGHTTAAVLAGIELLILALPMFGLVYTFIKTSRRAGVGLWHWSEGSVPRRLAASTGMLGAGALLAVMWLPQLPFAPSGTHGPAYTGDTWRPIGPQETGTVHDFVPAVPRPPAPDRTPAGVVPVTRRHATPTARPSATVRPGTAHATPSPTGTPGRHPTATVTPKGSSGVVGKTTPTATPTATATATPVAGSSVYATATLTPTATPVSATQGGIATPTPYPQPTLTPTPVP